MIVLFKFTILGNNKSMFESKSEILKIESSVAQDTYALNKKWLQNIDELIQRNLNTLTCNNLREKYYSLFGDRSFWS